MRLNRGQHPARPAPPAPQRRFQLAARSTKLLAACALSAAAVLVANTAFASTPRAQQSLLARAFAVLRERSSAADAGTPALREAIGGATSVVFATTDATGSDVYVATLAGGDVCLVRQPASSAFLPIAVACAHPAEALQKGVGMAAPSVDGQPAWMTLLLPTGVSTVTFANANGTTFTDPVVNNVASFSAATLTSASFDASDGTPQTIVEPAPQEASSG
jgi:hypothetical protein